MYYGSDLDHQDKKVSANTLQRQSCVKREVKLGDKKCEGVASQVRNRLVIIRQGQVKLFPMLGMMIITYCCSHQQDSAAVWQGFKVNFNESWGEYKPSIVYPFNKSGQTIDV